MLSLADAIERLYTAFADVPRPTSIDGCPCCIDNKDIGTLLSKPLRDLTGDELASYASSAFLTVGDVADYLYFLPRILEITATDLAWWPSPEVTARAIRSAGLDSWPPARRAALTDFLEVVVATAGRPDHPHDTDAWLCAVGRMGLDVQPLLALVAQDPRAVLAYFQDNYDAVPHGRLANGFWDESATTAHDAIVAWFYSPEIARVVFEESGTVLERVS